MATYAARLFFFFLFCQKLCNLKCWQRHFSNSKCICTPLMLIKYCWQSVNQAVIQPVSQSVSQEAAANLATFIKVIEPAAWWGGAWVVWIFLSHSYLSSCFHTQLCAICWAICKLAENLKLNSVLFLGHIWCENKFTCLTIWHLALNLKISCVYLSVPRSWTFVDLCSQCWLFTKHFYLRLHSSSTYKRW